jgi:hypothetical protein
MLKIDPEAICQHTPIFKRSEAQFECAMCLSGAHIA